MTSIEGLVTAAGGLLHKRDLVAHGATDRHLTAAVRSGRVRRPRRGWYSTWASDDPRSVAVAVGGRLTGASALHALGAWMWRRPPVVVSVPRGASRLRRRRGVRIVWDDEQLSGRGTTWSVDPQDALARMVDQLSFEDAVAVATWALREGLVAAPDLRAALGALRPDAAGLADWVDPRCESFLEVVGLVRLRRRGHRVQPQCHLPNGQRIDLVVDGLLAVELDGRATHASTFVADRTKDLRILDSSRIPVRVPYALVADTTAWESVCRTFDRVLLDHGVPRGEPSVPVGNSSSWRVLGPRGRRPWRLRPVRGPRGGVADGRGSRSGRGPDGEPRGAARTASTVAAATAAEGMRWAPRRFDRA